MPSDKSTYDDDYARATAVCVLRRLAAEVEEDSPIYFELHNVAETVEQRGELSLVPMEPCHLIDPAGEALCFADITGREPHDREACIEGAHALCARCLAIERVQDEDEL